MMKSTACTCLQAMKALLAAKQHEDPQGWQRFQSEISTLKLRSTRACRELDDAVASLDSSVAMANLSGASPGELPASVRRSCNGAAAWAGHVSRVEWQLASCCETRSGHRQAQGHGKACTSAGGCVHHLLRWARKKAAWRKLLKLFCSLNYLAGLNLALDMGCFDLQMMQMMRMVQHPKQSLRASAALCSSAALSPSMWTCTDRSELGSLPCLTFADHSNCWPSLGAACPAGQIIPWMCH